MKLRDLNDQDGNYSGVVWYCPACREHHFIRTVTAQGQHCWNFDGNRDSPTFTPSQRITWNQGGVDHTCHYTITKGKVLYHSDCSHDHVGREIDLPDLSSDDAHATS